MSFGSGKLYNASNRFSPKRGRAGGRSPLPRWHASLSPERLHNSKSRIMNEYSDESNNVTINNNQYYQENNSRYRKKHNPPLDTSKSLDDEIISFLNSSPRPESFQSRIETEKSSNAWKASEIYAESNREEDENRSFHNDGDSFLNEIRQEDESLYKFDETLINNSLNSEGHGKMTSTSVQLHYPGSGVPEHGSPQRTRAVKIDKKKPQKRVTTTSNNTHTIYSTRPSPHVKKRREQYLTTQSRNTHPYNASSILSAYGKSRNRSNNTTRKTKKKVSSKQQRMKDAALSTSKHVVRRSTSVRSTKRQQQKLRPTSTTNVSSNTSRMIKKKRKKKRQKNMLSNTGTSQSQLILDRSGAPVLPPSPKRLNIAKQRIEAWSKEESNDTAGSDKGSSRKIYRVPSSRFSNSSNRKRGKTKPLDRPSSAGARLTTRYNFDENDEEFLHKKIKTISKQKKNIKSLKLRKRGMEQSIAALQKEIQARDTHIKELHNIVKRKDRELFVTKGAKATEAANASGILNLSTDSIRSVGSQSYKERKNISKLEKTQQKMKSEIKELRRREQRAVEIHGALRNTIDKLRNEKDAFGDQIDDLKSTIRSLKRSLEAERQYNKELIRTEFGENEAMNLQEEKINHHGNNNKVTNRILRQETSRLKSLLDVSRGKVKDANNILNHFKSENENLKNMNNDLKVQLKNIKMKDRLKTQEMETVKESKKNKKNRSVAMSSDNTTSPNESMPPPNSQRKKNNPIKITSAKERDSPIAKLMQKKIDDDKASLSEYKRLKSMYDRVQRGSKQ